MTKLPVTINTNSVLFIEADPAAFGRIFAAMNSVDQVAVLSSMEEAMRPHRMQWDYIAIELEKPENRETRNALMQALMSSNDFDEGAAQAREAAARYLESIGDHGDQAKADAIRRGEA